MHRWMSSALLVWTMAWAMAAHAVEVDQAAAVAALKEGRLAVDVRSQIEYDAGTVLNAVRVDPVRLVNQMKQVLTDRNTVFVIFASTEQKANTAQQRLNKAGYLSVINGGDYEQLHNALYDTSDDPAE